MSVTVELSHSLGYRRNKPYRAAAWSRRLRKHVFIGYFKTRSEAEKAVIEWKKNELL